MIYMAYKYYIYVWFLFSHLNIPLEYDFLYGLNSGSNQNIDLSISGSSINCFLGQSYFLDCFLDPSMILYKNSPKLFAITSNVPSTLVSDIPESKMSLLFGSLAPFGKFKFINREKPDPSNPILYS